MTIKSSGSLSFTEIATEKGFVGSVGFPLGFLSTNNINTLNPASKVPANTSTASGNYPDAVAPHRVSEFYAYNHTYVAPTTTTTAAPTTTTTTAAATTTTTTAAATTTTTTVPETTSTTTTTTVPETTSTTTTTTAEPTTTTTTSGGGGCECPEEGELVFEGPCEYNGSTYTITRLFATGTCDELCNPYTTEVVTDYGTDSNCLIIPE